LPASATNRLPRPSSATLCGLFRLLALSPPLLAAPEVKFGWPNTKSAVLSVVRGWL